IHCKAQAEKEGERQDHVLLGCEASSPDYHHGQDERVNKRGLCIDRRKLPSTLVHLTEERHRGGRLAARPRRVNLLERQFSPRWPGGQGLANLRLYPGASRSAHRLRDPTPKQADKDKRNEDRKRHRNQRANKKERKSEIRVDRYWHMNWLLFKTLLE